VKDDGDRPITLAEFRRFARRAAWAFGLVVVIGAVGLWRTETASNDAADAAHGASTAIAASTAEGKARRKAVGGIIRIFCSVNNEQDQVLAQLLAVSIQGAAHRRLNAQRQRALRLFVRTEHVLSQKLACSKLVRRFQRGLPVPPPPDPLRKLLTAGIAALLPSSPPSHGSGTAATPPPGTATAPQARITPTAPTGATTPSPPPTATEPSGGSGGASGGGGGGSQPPPPSPPPKPTPPPPPPDCIVNVLGVCVPNPG
jgi:hypothetical protein